MSWIGTPLWLIIETAVWRPLVGVPVTDACTLGHLAESPVERVFCVQVAVFVTEHEVGVVPGGAGSQTLG
jgi:hypothetical protein